MRTTLAPDNEAKLESANCCEIVHGLRSPDALLPRARLFITVPLLIEPSRHTCIQIAYTHIHIHTQVRNRPPFVFTLAPEAHDYTWLTVHIGIDWYEIEA